MVAVLYITSDQDAGGGKTAVAAALAAQLSSNGKKVGYFKPLSATPEDDADVAFIGPMVVLDARKDKQTVPLPLPSDLIDGRGIPKEVARKLRRSLKTLVSGNEIVLVEGPNLAISEGGAPSISGEMAGILDSRVLLVVTYRPNLTAENVYDSCSQFGELLGGVLINAVGRYRERMVSAELASAIESAGIKFLGAIPEDRLMLSVTVGQLAQHLEGEWVLGQEKAEELVESFLIGGNIMDSGPTYFGRTENKAVIVRGDRPDIQLAALSAPFTCLVLTGAHEPNQYVYHEAEQKEVPLLVVQSDTNSTADALNTIVERSTVHHPRKLERFQQLLAKHADMEAFEAML